MRKIEWLLFTGAIACGIAYAVVVYRAMWNQPYNFGLILLVPWYGWVLALLSLLFYVLFSVAIKEN